MGSLHRVAAAAAMAIAFSLGAATAPSFAETVNTAVSVISNEQQTVQVPPLTVEPAPPPAAPPAPEPAPPVRLKAESLAQLVAQQSVPAALDREAECLAASVYFESKGEPLEGQLAVAEVVLNRANAGGRFPSSICKVVFQKGQFHFVRGGGFPPIAKSGRAWREAVAVSRIAMDQAWASRASKAMYFHARRVSPGWNKVRLAQLGNHVFYR